VSAQAYGQGARKVRAFRRSVERSTSLAMARRLSVPISSLCSLVTRCPWAADGQAGTLRVYVALWSD
jgi:hypothetical protein